MHQTAPAPEPDSPPEMATPSVAARIEAKGQGGTDNGVVPPAEPDSPSSDAETLRRIGVGIAATCAGFNLRRASRAVTQHFDHALAPVGLRTTQFTLLGALALGGPVSTNQLSAALVVDRTTLTRNLRLLRDAGLVETRAPETGREILFVLTDAGRESLARAIPHWKVAQDGIVAAFGASLWSGLLAELDRLVSGTLALDPNAQGPISHPAMRQVSAS